MTTKMMSMRVALGDDESRIRRISPLSEATKSIQWNFEFSRLVQFPVFFETEELRALISE